MSWICLKSSFYKTCSTCNILSLNENCRRQRSLLVSTASNDCIWVYDYTCPGPKTLDIMVCNLAVLRVVTHNSSYNCRLPKLPPRYNST